MKFPPEPGHCSCGEPLHYANTRTKRVVDSLVKEWGENVKVTVGARSWSVPRHYIALHGLKAQELPQLGFPEIA